MKNTLQTAVSLLIVGLLLAGCAISRTETPLRIGLLGPFEGRYREVGYDALYAARLALADSGADHIELLVVDDGGTAASAQQRARSLTADPRVIAVVVTGYAATEPETLNAFGDLPVIVSGNWGTNSLSENIFILSSADIQSQLDSPHRPEITDAARIEAPHVGGDVFGLSSFPRLRADTGNIAIITTSTLPDDDFRARYIESDPFAPEPGLLATMTYDAVQIVIAAIVNSHGNRQDIITELNNIDYDGLTGSIRFEDGFRVDAPINRFIYDDQGVLITDNVMD